MEQPPVCQFWGAQEPFSQVLVGWELVALHLLVAMAVAPGNRHGVGASGVCGRVASAAAPPLEPLAGQLELSQTSPRRVVQRASSPQRDPREISSVLWKPVDPAPENETQ